MAGAFVSVETDERQSKPLGTYLVRLTKLWNEEKPARWPQSLSRGKELLRECVVLCAKPAAIVGPHKHILANERKCNSARKFNEAERSLQIVVSARWRAVERG